MIRNDLHASLERACRAAIQHGNVLADIKADKWSEAYGGCGTELIRATWERELTELSRQPQNTGEIPE